MRGDDDAEAWLGHRRILQRKIILHSLFFLHNSLVRILYIDLASNKGTLALVTEQEVLAIDHIDQRIEDQELLPRVEGVLGAGRWVFQDLTHIACVVGPGGFMSLRVGVALANTLADQLQIPIAGVHLSDVYEGRWQEGKRAKGQDALWLHSTKKQELFVRGFGDAAKVWPEATHVTLEDLLNILRRDAPLARLLWVGELIPEHRDAIEALGMQECTPCPIEEILPRFLAAQEYKKQILEPWYGRGW
jgi:tRNA threonylcarbamoyl adenosine modification protein YeaZ